MIDQIVDSVIGSFDFGFCISVNILTYLIIKTIDYYRNKGITKWQKRMVLIFSIIALSVVYYLINTDVRLLVNSAILAPVSWSWIFKPICSKLNIDYKKCLV